MEKRRKGASVIIFDMKKTGFFVVFTILTSFCFGGEKFKFSVSSEGGMMFGQINEYVLVNNVSDSLYKLSELNWELKPLYYAGAELDFSAWDKLCVGLEGKIGLPVVVGKMIDRDWMNIDTYPEHAYATNYSEHDNLLYSYSNGKIHAGYQFYIGDLFAVTPQVSFQYQEFIFIGQHGTGSYGKSVNSRYQYPYDDEDESHLDAKDWSSRQRVITYQQRQFIPYAGINLRKDFENGIGISFLAELSPYTWIIANDKHYSSDFSVGMDKTRTYYRDFLDKPKGFGTFNTEFDCYYTLNDRHRFSLNLSYFMIPTLVGKSGIKKIDDGLYYADSVNLGGASAQIFSVSLSYSFIF